MSISEVECIIILQRENTLRHSAMPARREEETRRKEERCTRKTCRRVQTQMKNTGEKGWRNAHKMQKQKKHRFKGRCRKYTILLQMLK
jgi:hypothetical protein